MASTSLQSPWRSNGAASTVTGNFRTVFILLRPRLKRRRRSATLCLDSSTSSGSSCSSSPSKGGDFGHLISEKSIKKGGLADGSIVIVEKIKPCDAIGEEKGKKENSGNKLVNWSKLMAKRKRPLSWRILFGSSRIKNIILLNVAAVVYASNIPVVKEVEAVMDPAAFSAVRFVMSAIPFLPFVFRAKDDAKTRNAGIELGMWVSLGYLVEALGLLTSEAGRASFISLFTVIVVPLLDGILGSIIPARTWFGVLMSVVGVGMLECSGSPPNVGDLLNFLSAIFFGIHMLRTEHISRCTKQENFLALLGYEISVVAVMSTLWLVIGGWVDGTQDIQQASWTWMEMWNWLITFPWFPALYTGIFSTGLCLWVEISAMRDVSATETAIIYGLEPVWGAAFAWFLLGERWGTVGWIGAALVLGGSLTVQIYGSSTPFTEVKNKETEKISVLSVLDKKKLKNGLSASPVVVRSREDMKDMLK